MKKIIYILLLILFISACNKNVSQSETTLKCPENYILIATECCLDIDKNNICDKDQGLIEEQGKKELETGAKEFARLMESDDFYKLYDMITEERKSVISREEFIRRYAKRWGREQYRSVVFRDASLRGEKGDVTFYLTYASGYEEVSSVYDFIKTNNGWKFDGFSDILYAFCDKPADCGNEVLFKACEQTCLVTGAPFKGISSCVRSVCRCSCFDEEKGSGGNVNPDWGILH